MKTKSFNKYKDEVLDYVIDWTKYLLNSGSDTISTSTWVEDSGGITIDSPSASNTTKTATVWLSGGSGGRTYTVENTIVTASGRTAKRIITVRVTEPSTNTVGSGDYT